MGEVPKCAECGAELPGGALGGLCPQCLGRVVFGIEPAMESKVKSPNAQEGTGESKGESSEECKVDSGSDRGERGTLKVEPEADMVREPTGMMIGRYKLLQKIGEGGFGIVYMAEQVAPVQRKVALKVIKAGMDTREVIARFEAERQALALMDHPNIAKVLDAGETAAGRPYFVMELVKGIPITEYCDQAQLCTTERLELFIKVCHAVQHAHQKGIIHRDIKPSNVLVTLHDGEPVPKVIDFGVAKALGQKLTEKTLFTAFQHMIGTPAYMSPEQAELSGLDIDTRSDIYSLGVLLYELLTGVTPFAKETLAKAALDEIRRMIRETEPPKPSTRLQTLGDKLPEVAKRRHTEAATLGRLVRGDLDWIAMKCLEKDRRRRYETANSLASDVERHLNHEPVTAAAPSTVYLVGKFVRRHRAGVSAAAMILLALGLGFFATLLGLARARRAEAQEKVQRAHAEQLRSTAQEQARQIGRQLYASQVRSGLQAWQNGDLAGALAELKASEPQAGAGQEDLRGFEWYYLWRLCHSEELTLVGHTGRVCAVSFSPDGQWLLSGGDDSKARIWDARTGQERATLGENPDGITAATFSPDGARIATGLRGGTIRLWDAATHQQLLELSAFTNDVGALAFSPDGYWLAASSAKVGRGSTPDLRFIDPDRFSAEVKLWSAADGVKTMGWSAHNAGVHALRFAPDGKTLATASVDGRVILWDFPAGTQRLVLTNFGVPVLSVVFSATGTRLAVGGGDLRRRETLLRILDAATGQELSDLTGHRGAVFTMAFSPDGETLATAGMDQTVRLWDFAKGTEVRHLKGHTDTIWSLAFDPTGRKLASASWDKTVKVWAAVQPQAVRVLPGMQQYCLRFSPNGEYLSGGGNRVMLLKPGVGEQPLFLPDYQGADIVIAWSADGKLLATTGMDQQVTLWDMSARRKLAVLQGHQSKIISLAFSPDGRTLASGAEAPDPRIYLWDVTQQRERLVVHMRTSSIPSLVFTGDGRGLISGSFREIVCTDTETGRELWQLDSGPRLAISPDRRWLAAAEKHTYSLRLIDLASRKVEWATHAHNDEIYEVAFSPDGRTLASGSWDGTAKLWSVATGEEIFRYDAPGVVWTVAFSADGRYWAVGSGSASRGEITLFTAAMPHDTNLRGPSAAESAGP